MTDDGKLMQQSERGTRARNIIEEPLFVEAMQAIQERITKGWQESGPDDDALRERAYLMQKLHQNFREHLETYIKTGKAADRDLLEIRKKRGLFRNG